MGAQLDVFRWPVDPTVYVGLAGLVGGYAWLARRGGARARHLVFFYVAVALIWLALETPLDTIGDRFLQSAHMIQHMVLMAVAPPFLLLGLTPEMARRVLHAVPRPLRRVLDPIPAQILYAAGIVGWHVPGAFDLALRDQTVHVLEHISFLAFGLVFWWSLIDATSSRAARPLGPVQKLIHLFVGTLPMMAVALPLQFTPDLLYAPYATAPRLNGFFTPKVDQTVAGALMMFIDMGVMTGDALIVFFRWVGGAQRRDYERAEAYADLDAEDEAALRRYLRREARVTEPR